nr:hypothetical protein [Burkholderia ubonensis]
MSRRANAWDNAPMESFFKTLKVERIYQTHYDRSMSRCTWKRGRVALRYVWVGAQQLMPLAGIPRNATRLVVDSAALDWCEFV